ncbi:tRNA wybutosine-synthesizing protein 2/3/4 isoform X2 [Phalaenopsis equestris]|uniref:tRNA wybutosine-synthesizing protein 2/3/4 isoform X2 n=1 Tax=Phalaenopsis equestris TaxID=78828 RepID=UPI0009E5B438|nr:tRNA wybutosine-synthesizing protein 2/3/4 isoform X2 [Phalaenopsis equestris]
MDFELRKAKTLSSLAAPLPDKSPKGSIDAPIAPFLDVINLHSSFFTTSSCSGRISILRQPGESLKPNPDDDKINPRRSKKKAGGGGWIFVSHEPADPEAVVDLLFKSPAARSAVEMEGAEGGNLVFRFEPLIVAVECKDVMAAQELVATAIACGFRESGITSMHKRVMVSIRCSIRLEVPLGQVGLIMVSPEYVRYLTGIANEKMEANRRRTDSFFHVLQDKVLPGSAKTLIHSSEKTQARVAGERNLLDFEANQRNVVSKKLQAEREQLQSPNRHNVLNSVENKGMHRLSLSVVSLTILGEPIEKLFLWGHSANPLINNGVKEVIIFGGFGGIGNHARRNYTLLLDTQSGHLKEVDAIGSPSPRVGHTSTAVENILYVIGGRGGPMQIFDDVWAFNTTEKRWTLLECIGHTFRPRHRHATAAIGAKIYAFGGLNNEVIYSCMNVLNTETLDWINASIYGELPSARHSHSMAAYGTHLLMFGGHDGQKALGDLYSFDTKTSIWKRVKTTGRAPSPTFSHSMFVYKDFVGIIGGCPLTQHNEELSLLNLINKMWINVSINSFDRVIWIRSSTSVIDDELIIVGGGASCYAFGTKFSYPMKMSLNLASIEDTYSCGVNEESVTCSAMEGQHISQLNGSKLQDRSTALWPYLEADLSNNEHGIYSDPKNLALQVKKKHAKLVKDVLKKFGWMDLTKKVYHSFDGLHICLPISREFYNLYQKESLNSKEKAIDLCIENVLLKNFSVNGVSISMALDIFSSCKASIIIDDTSYDKRIPSTPQKVMREMVSSLLTEKGLPLRMLEELPVRWERLGDITVLPVSSFSDPRWDSIAEELWPIVAKSLRALRLARQGRILPTETRDSTLEILVGDSGWVTHQENGILYSFDATKCMFSSGNLSEKLRMACQDCSNEVIVDLFAGIGYFVLPFLVKARAKLVYACEWNLHAIKALRHNIHANSVADRCIILEGDNRVTAPEGVADRVCLGLLPSSECSWRTAVKALRAQGGLLHIHGNVKDSEEKSWMDYVVESIGRIAVSEGLLWDVSVQHVERVKSYGPHIRHIVADIRCKNL